MWTKKYYLWNLSAFAAASFSNQDKCLVFFQQVENVVSVLENWQLLSLLLVGKRVVRIEDESRSICGVQIRLVFRPWTVRRPFERWAERRSSK